MEQARQLSSGTIAALSGYDKYVDIERVQTEFVEFCQTREFTCWQDAWNEFVGVTQLELTWRHSPAVPARAEKTLARETIK